MALLRWIRRLWREFISSQPYTLSDRQPPDDREQSSSD